ncbi:MAG: nicotinate-nucleotide adenylyltransferase [Deltaproteobacteria bacterium]|nr:nicotinate-nucleotide adenylyltransferase [Deltaproteobacteria bacterium]
MFETGVIHGRFQVLHNDHITYLMAGRQRCRHLVVGITNPDPNLTGEDPADPGRSLPAANPLTYYERYRMVQAALLEKGLAVTDFSLVPLPINFPDLYRYYVPLDAVFFLTIYDSWGKKKLERFRSLGLRTEVLWERPLQEKGLSAAGIRRMIIDGDPWEHLVPPSTAQMLKQWDLPARLRQIAASE